MMVPDRRAFKLHAVSCLSFEVVTMIFVLQFVAVRLVTKLNNLSVMLHDNTKK